jgi:hypothetical protein
MKPKFQPTPSKIRAPEVEDIQAHQGQHAGRAYHQQAQSCHGPLAITRNQLAKKLGTNMASTCQMPMAASPTLWPQPTMAMGAAVIKNAISP